MSGKRSKLLAHWMALWIAACGAGNGQNSDGAGGEENVGHGGGSGGEGNPTIGGMAGQSSSGGQGDTRPGSEGGNANTPGTGGVSNTAGTGGGPQNGGSSSTLPGSTVPKDGDRSIGPTYTPARESRMVPDVPRGTTVNFVMKGGESAALPGDYMRNCAIYVPSQYVKGTPAPFIVLQDGGYPFVNPFTPALDTIRNTFDNLIHEKKIPPTVIVFAGNRSADEKTNQRGYEYLSFSSRYADWVVNELLPRAELATAASLPNQAVTLSQAPQSGAAAGCSSGGVAALGLAWWRPERFGRAISYSGTFQSGQYASAINTTNPSKPLRIWLEVGTRDDSGTADANKRVASALKQKGYKYHFDLAANATHCDVRTVTMTFPEAMLWIWSDLVPAR